MVRDGAQKVAVVIGSLPPRLNTGKEFAVAIVSTVRLKCVGQGWSTTNLCGCRIILMYAPRYWSRACGAVIVERLMRSVGLAAAAGRSMRATGTRSNGVRCLAPRPHTRRHTVLCTAHARAAPMGNENGRALSAEEIKSREAQVSAPRGTHVIEAHSLHRRTQQRSSPKATLTNVRLIASATPRRV